MAFGDVTLGLESEVAVGAAAGCPTEEEVTCKMEAAEFENIAPQSAVGESSGLVGLEIQKVGLNIVLYQSIVAYIVTMKIFIRLEKYLFISEFPSKIVITCGAS